MSTFRGVKFPCYVTPGDELIVERMGDDELYLRVVRCGGGPPPRGDVVLSAPQAIELAKRILAAFSTTPVPWKDL